MLSGMSVAALAALATAPEAWAGARRAGTAAAVTAALLAAGALVVQPSLAIVYAVAAIACLVCVGRDQRGSLTLLAFAVVMSGLTAWSGVISGSFPLPLPLGVILTMAATTAVVAFGSEKQGRLASVASALAAGLAALVVMLHPALEPARENVATDLRIARGDSVSVALPAGSKRVRISISGGNVAALKGGAVIGLARLEPGGESRELRIGDFADWGARRRAHFLSADNPRPLEPAGPVLGSGREAFLSGAGVVRLDVSGARRLTIEALPSIGDEGRLLVARVEVER
jgi:hypothetical protein